MKKEVLVAIIIGFSLGLLITFGVWTANKAIKQNPSAPANNEEIASQTAPSPTPTPVPSLIILSPEDNSISQKEKIIVSGQAVPQATIALFYDEGEQVIETDETGLFETEITLKGGSNEIEIISFDQEENEIKKTLTVVYSTSEI